MGTVCLLDKADRALSNKRQMFAYTICTEAWSTV